MPRWTRLRVALRLAGDAGAHARQGLAAALGDRLAAIVAIGRRSRPPASAPGAEHRVLDGVVDLVLHRAVARPAAGHGGLFLVVCSD